MQRATAPRGFAPPHTPRAPTDSTHAPPLPLPPPFPPHRLVGSRPRRQRRPELSVLGGGAVAAHATAVGTQHGGGAVKGEQQLRLQPGGREGGRDRGGRGMLAQRLGPFLGDEKGGDPAIEIHAGKPWVPCSSMPVLCTSGYVACDMLACSCSCVGSLTAAGCQAAPSGCTATRTTQAAAPSFGPGAPPACAFVRGEKSVCFESEQGKETRRTVCGCVRACWQGGWEGFWTW